MQTEKDIVSTYENPVGLDGIEFIEYASPEPEKLEALFTSFGFVKYAKHKRKNVTIYRQNDINFIINSEPGTFAEQFARDHGPSIVATGFRTHSAQKAFEVSRARGGRPIASHKDPHSHSFPAIYGIGDSAIYFLDSSHTHSHFKNDFEFLSENPRPSGLGMQIIDHLTNNVPKGDLQKWCDFYASVFGFREVRYFDIRGQKTGLFSKVMRSPCNKITIPINEPTEGKSQIQEYLDEYKGSGIQHVALLTHDICRAVFELRKNHIRFLETPDTYFEALPERLPHVKEPFSRLKELQILADGDEHGYLLQIFTQNMIGPIFYEVIQRHNHGGFGEGNFQALFDAIERDQKRRGYLT